MVEVAIEGATKVTTKVNNSPSQKKETIVNQEEARKKEIQIPIRPQKVDHDPSFVPESQEVLKEGDPLSQDSNTSPISKEPPILVNRILERLSASTLGQLARMEALFDKCNEDEDSPWSEIIRRKKKKNRDPSSASPASTRSRVKANLGRNTNAARRKNKTEIRKEEARINIMDGMQRTIQEAYSSIKA